MAEYIEKDGWRLAVYPPVREGNTWMALIYVPDVAGSPCFIASGRTRDEVMARARRLLADLTRGLEAAEPVVSGSGADIVALVAADLGNLKRMRGNVAASRAHVARQRAIVERLTRQGHLALKATAEVLPVTMIGHLSVEQAILDRLERASERRNR